MTLCFIDPKGNGICNFEGTTIPRVGDSIRIDSPLWYIVSKVSHEICSTTGTHYVNVLLKEETFKEINFKRK